MTIARRHAGYSTISTAAITPHTPIADIECPLGKL